LAHNSYSHISLSVLEAKRTVSTIRYNSLSGEFQRAATADYPFEIRLSEECDVSNLGEALIGTPPNSTSWPYYFAALLLEQKAEIPICTPGGHAFGSVAVLESQPDTDLKKKTIAFFQFRNALRFFYGKKALTAIVSEYGSAIAVYNEELASACTSDDKLAERLKQLEADVMAFAAAERTAPRSYAEDLLRDLAHAQDWSSLREHAERHADSSDSVLAHNATRMLALSLANSEVAQERLNALEQYLAIAATAAADYTDHGNAARLALNLKKPEFAKEVILSGLKRFPNQSHYFIELGLTVVSDTGDRGFRDQLLRMGASRG
jgi:hypothetical protein